MTLDLFGTGEDGLSSVDRDGRSWSRWIVEHPYGILFVALLVIGFSTYRFDLDHTVERSTHRSDASLYFFFIFSCFRRRPQLARCIWNSKKPNKDRSDED